MRLAPVELHGEAALGVEVEPLLAACSLARQHRAPVLAEEAASGDAHIRRGAPVVERGVDVEGTRLVAGLEERSDREQGRVAHEPDGTLGGERRERPARSASNARARAAHPRHAARRVEPDLAGVRERMKGRIGAVGLVVVLRLIDDARVQHARAQRFVARHSAGALEHAGGGDAGRVGDAAVVVHDLRARGERAGDQDEQRHGHEPA